MVSLSRRSRTDVTTCYLVSLGPMRQVGLHSTSAVTRGRRGRGDVKIINYCSEVKVTCDAIYTQRIRAFGVRAVVQNLKRLVTIEFE